MVNKSTVITFLLIAIISWMSFKGYDLRFFDTIKPLYKHLINFSLLAATALLGHLHFRKASEKWMLNIWSMTYAFVILLLIAVGTVDLAHPIHNYLIRDSIATMRMFFTGPIPFLVSIFLSNINGHKKSTTDDTAVSSSRQ